MKILMISSDPQILILNTEARMRMEEYASLFQELHVVVLGRGGTQSHQPHYRGEASIVGGNLFLYSAGGGMVFTRMLRGWMIGRALAARIRFDVVSAQGADETGLVGFFTARASRVPFQLQIHTDVMSPWYRRASWKERLRYYLAKFLIPRADCLRVVSQRIQRSLSSKFIVLPIFTDIAKYTSASADLETERRFKDHDFKMLAVGRFLDREKNFSMLIEVMRELIKRCPRALLVLVGDGPDRTSYQSLVTNYQLEQNVLLEPWRGDLPSFYKSFDLFLSPSNYEGWGRTVIEAMASGLPVVMTDTGLAGEVVEDAKNGRVVPVGDAGSFLGAVRDLYQNPEKRRAFAAAGRKTVMEMRPKTKEEYLELYKRSFLSCL